MYRAAAITAVLVQKTAMTRLHQTPTAGEGSALPPNARVPSVDQSGQSISEIPGRAQSTIADAPQDVMDASEHKVIIKALTGVRAIAAGWVVIGHFAPTISVLFPNFGKMDWLTQSGYLGVDLFFVLSGFILLHNYHAEFRTFKADSYRKFLWLRLARIYPVHLFAMLTLIVLLIGAHVMHRGLTMPERFTAIDFVRNLFLVQAWGFSKDLSWNIPAWSVSAEWFAYLLFPIVAMVTLRIRSLPSMVIGVVLMYAVMLGYFEFKGYQNNTIAIQGALIRVTTQFIAGCLLYRIYRTGFGARWNWSWITVGLIAAVVATQALVPPQPIRGSLYPAPLLALLILALARSTGRLTGFLGSRQMVFWGEASYALYMTHDVVRLALTKLLPVEKFAARGTVMAIAFIAIYAATIFGMAVGTYLLVERPARARMRSLIDPRHRRPHVVDSLTPYASAASSS
jgi:peptidoglycan/LPS O-acetylase OafA/YrhL